MRGRESITYVTLFTGEHEVIFANGLPVETLYPGPMALARLGPFERAKVLSFCPTLRQQGIAIAYPPARRLLSMRETRALPDAMRRRQPSGEPVRTNQPAQMAHFGSH